MPTGLKRTTGFGHLHSITFSCYQRRALWGNVRARNVAVQILREVRARYGFALIGYVIMPEHVHLLISEVDAVKPATVIFSLGVGLGTKPSRSWKPDGAR